MSTSRGWATAGPQTFVAAGAGTTLADTGALDGTDNRRFILWIAVSGANAVVIVERRNSGASVISSQYITVLASTTTQVQSLVGIHVDQDDKLIAYLNGNITGTIQVSILYGD